MLVHPRTSPRPMRTILYPVTAQSTLPHSTSIRSSIQPQLRWFISRGNGILVPLIPADELPTEVQLQDVPRNMDFARIRNMECLGEYPYAGTYTLASASIFPTNRADSSLNASPHKQIQPTSSIQKQFLAPDAMVRSGSSNRSLPASGCPPGQVTAQEDTQAVIDAIVAADPIVATNAGYTSRRPPPASGIEPDQEKKEYCTYWIRTGECDYTQQGCLFKHEMPDKVTLEKIGFRNFPRWWQEKTAIKIGAPTTTGPKQVTWMQRHIAGSMGGADFEAVEDTKDEESGPLGLKSAITGRPIRDDKQAQPDSVQQTLAASRKITSCNGLSTTAQRSNPPPGQLIDFAVLEPTRVSALHVSQTNSRASTPSLVSNSSASPSPPGRPCTPAECASQILTVHDLHQRTSVPSGELSPYSTCSSPTPFKTVSCLTELAPLPVYEHKTIFPREISTKDKASSVATVSRTTDAAPSTKSSTAQGLLASRHAESSLELGGQSAPSAKTRSPLPTRSFAHPNPASTEVATARSVDARHRERRELKVAHRSRYAGLTSTRRKGAPMEQ